MKKVAINGFGRIGRNTLRAAVKSGIFHKLDFAAINDPGMTPELAAYLLEYDSVMGRFEGEIWPEPDAITVNGKKIKLLTGKDPLELTWKDLGIDVVIESSGFFTEAVKAKGHIQAGAKKVLISAPAKGEDITINLGVNQEMYDTTKHNIIAMASCTTNCLAPVAKVLNREFGIINAFMTTAHGYTSSQLLLDGPSKKDVRRGRAAAINIVPTSTGAAKAVELVLPEVKGKLEALALRVPVPAGSIIDLVATTEKKITVDSVNQAFKRASEEELRGIIHYTEIPLVSSDYVGSPYSCVVDAKLTRVLGENMVKVFAWYDNEFGYSSRLAECALFIAEKM